MTAQPETVTLEVIEPAPMPAPTALAECEAVIDSALERMASAWHEIGAALQRINRERLYRAFCDTFDEYVSQRYPRIARSTAYEWMEAAPVYRVIEQHNASNPERVIEPPDTISHARALSRVPEMLQPQAIRRAHEIASNAGKAEPTLYDFQRAAAEIMEEPAPPSAETIKHERAQRALKNQILRLWEALDSETQYEVLGLLKTSLKDDNR